MRYGVDISAYRARQVRQDDFRRFSHIVVLDAENLATLQKLKPKDGTASISLLLDHVPERKGEAVADPYYGGEEDFQVTWEDVTIGAQGLACHLAERK